MGNFTQYLVIIYKGILSEKNTESLCCTIETSTLTKPTILQSKKKKRRLKRRGRLWQRGGIYRKTNKMSCSLKIKDTGWGTHVNPWLFHFNVWQNPLQKKKKKENGKKKGNKGQFCFIKFFLLMSAVRNFIRRATGRMWPSRLWFLNRSSYFCFAKKLRAGWSLQESSVDRARACACFPGGSCTLHVSLGKCLALSWLPFAKS